MATRAATGQSHDWRAIFRQSVMRSVELALAGALLLLVLIAALSLASYARTDPSFSTAAGGPVANWMGRPGALIAERLLFLFGPASVLLLPFTYLAGIRLWRAEPQVGIGRRLALLLLAMALVGSALSLAFPGVAGELPAQWGGLAGLLGSGGVMALAGLAPEAAQRWIPPIAALAAAVTGLVLAWRAMALDRRLLPAPRLARPAWPGWLARKERDTAGGAAPFAGDASPAERASAERQRPQPVPDNRPPPEISAPSLPPSRADVVTAGRQGDFFGPFTLPSIDLLDAPPPAKAAELDKMALERNARLLESVLDDFHVKGEIKAVRPGPVVTMYELEPAPGTKAVRVIGLAEDIARNMSAISARVSSIPGKTVMGIELPNAHREMVSLNEMIASGAFAGHTGALPIILGKDIAGAPVIADLATMPHLLVAGTTGSGKSVGLNCILLSLLYRFTPEQCRMILVDPKVLELESYHDIPHLLSPVVTEPGKAVRALKWAVEQMEERYRRMSSIGVRNLAGFNEKVKAAIAKGKPLSRRVQAGYDQETGLPVHEEEVLDYEPMPLIVVIVDELADLMVTAGKEIEVLIQRLAQKSRAAGIHLIMATQRPSVDVITGVIKANLPTRVSFHVTSKIDSRTILGEHGAEQLLGKGDMLYMANGKAVQRVHGPFVSDEEVLRVADHWRGQGAPDYIQSVTEEPDDAGFAFDEPSPDDSPEDKQFRIACQLVFEAQKASASWLQRQMRVGYNVASRLIERMEKEGMVGAPDHVGRRQIYRDREGNPV